MRVPMAGFPLALALWIGSFPGLAAPPSTHQAALIQERGTPLNGGEIQGESQLPLERAAGGDTPILTFQSARGPVRLLLDTGAASAMVTPALAERLGLEITSLAPDAFSMAGGGERCDTLRPAKVQLPDLHLPATSRHPLRLRGLEALVIPVPALPEGVDGVIGAPSLRQLPFLIDPQGGSVRFGRLALQWRQTMPSPRDSLLMSWQRGVPLLPIRLRPPAGKPIRTHTALADTGAEGLFLTPALASILLPLGPAQSARLVGVCGQQMVQRQRLMGIGLGLQAPPIQSVEAILTSNPVFSLLGVEAIVGQELLRERRQLWRLDATPPMLELW
jgi:hypothetical protein